jgi:hypothetical protein
MSVIKRKNIKKKAQGRENTRKAILEKKIKYNKKIVLEADLIIRSKNRKRVKKKKTANASRRKKKKDIVRKRN